MGRKRLAYALVTMLVALLALPAFAHAARGDEVIADCNDDGHIDGSYSQEDYREAQQNLPSDIDQYSDCRDVIAQARADGSRRNDSRGNDSGGGSDKGGGSGGASNKGGGGQSRTGGSPKPHAGDPALETRSGAYAPSQDDKAAFDRAREAAAAGDVPDGLGIPAATGFKPAGATNSIPLPVLLALIAVGLLVAATTALVARRRLPDLTSRVTSRFSRS